MSSDMIADALCATLCRSSVLLDSLNHLRPRYWREVVVEIRHDQLMANPPSVVLTGVTIGKAVLGVIVPVEIHFGMSQREIMEATKAAAVTAVRELHLESLPAAARYVKA